MKGVIIMKRILSLAVLSLMVFDANAASNARPAMSSKMVMSAPRYTASVNQLNGMAGITNVKEHTDVVEPVVEPEPEVDRREAERDACINNNIGIGNTFVWASRYSDTSNYASMVEDVKNPENNICFVRVELKSDDPSRVSVNDVPGKYFMWGEIIDCGSWANADEIEKRILDARKSARVGGIVAASVGGAGIGVGTMELFGNDLIGGKVQGQKQNDMTIYTSYLNSLSEKEQYINAMRILKTSNSLDSFTAEQQKFISTYGN